MPSEHKRLFIYGASGHAKAVVDIIEKSASHQIVGFIDDNPALHGKNCFGYPVLGGFEQLHKSQNKSCQLIIAIGTNDVRHRVYERLKALGYEFACAIHPSAQIGRGVTLGSGTVVMAGAAINSDTVIGEHVIVNTGATVDHDCVIEDFTHISPGAHLAGNVTVGRLAHIGIGASVIQAVHIGEGSIIGAGAAVIEDLPDWVVAVGVPARIIRRKEES